jgi:hypothetical protein
MEELGLTSCNLDSERAALKQEKSEEIILMQQIN